MISLKQFISVKLFLALIVAFASTIMVFITAMSFGLSSGSSFDSENIHYLGYFFIQTLSYTMVALIFSILFKRGALAIGVFFLYSLVLENLIAKPLSHYFNDAGRFFPLESTDTLIPLPVFENVQRQLSDPPNYSLFLVVAIVYLAIYTFIAVKKFESDDL